MIRIWYSTKDFADYIVNNTKIKDLEFNESKLFESDANNANNFHKMPDHIKKILYLDAPDLIIEHNNEPICSIEVSQEAGTGHNAFQRFPRIAAAVENNVPALYIYPEAIFVTRQSDSGKWDSLNPNIFKALEQAMQVYEIPALLFKFPTEYPEIPTNPAMKGKKFDSEYISCPDSNDSEMKSLFKIINTIVDRSLNGTTRPKLTNERPIMERRSWMQNEFVNKGGETKTWSPITATIEVDSVMMVDYLKKYYRNCEPELLLNREKTIIYQVDAGFRGDPYPGALAALDYLCCRTGKTYEDRDKNLVLCWGKATVEDGKLVVTATNPENSSVNKFVSSVSTVRSTASRCLLNCSYSDLQKKQIPRYFMQVRYGCTFTKSKEIRCYSYFADAMLFADGAFWREG